MGVVILAKHVQIIAMVGTTADLVILRVTKIRTVQGIITGRIMTVVAFGRCWLRDCVF